MTLTPLEHSFDGKFRFTSHHFNYVSCLVPFPAQHPIRNPTFYILLTPVHYHFIPAPHLWFYISLGLCTMAVQLLTLPSSLFIYLFFKLINLFLLIYFWLCWVFLAAHGLSLVAVSGGYSSLWWLLLLRSTGSQCVGFSSCGTWAQQLWLVGSRAQPLQLWCTGSVGVAHGLSCSVACGIFPDQGSNPCPLHWQADS